jgi:hypothetical protein
MPNLSVFYKTLLENLRAYELKDSASFRSKFKGCRSWTSLMLGSADTREAGLVRQALKDVLPLDPQFSHERYIDLAVFSGNWWGGRQIASIIMEHENNTLEFKGTISDLLRYQALQKIAIFYEDAGSRKKELENWVQDVFNHFQQQGFSESLNTEYLIVFGPPFDLGESGVGTWSAMHFTNATRDLIKWL